MNKIADSFYTENGSFIPLTDFSGNSKDDLSLLRNTYMEAERNYFKALLNIPNVMAKFSALQLLDSDELFEKAMYYQQLLESGNIETEEEKKEMAKMTLEERNEYHIGKLEEIEGIICLLLAATRDRVYIFDLVDEYSPQR